MTPWRWSISPPALVLSSSATPHAQVVHVKAITARKIEHEKHAPYIELGIFYYFITTGMFSMCLLREKICDCSGWLTTLSIKEPKATRFVLQFSGMLRGAFSVPMSLHCITHKREKELEHTFTFMAMKLQSGQRPSTSVKPLYKTALDILIKTHVWSGSEGTKGLLRDKRNGWVLLREHWHLCI